MMIPQGTLRIPYPPPLSYAFYNLKKSNTTALYTALTANAMARIMTATDSLGQGAGTAANDATGTPGSRTNLSWPMLLSGMLNTYVRSTNCNARIGNGSVATTGANLFDPRMAIGTASCNALTAGLGGRNFSTLSGASEFVYTLAGGQTFDRLRWFPLNPAVGDSVTLRNAAATIIETVSNNPGVTSGAPTARDVSLTATTGLRVRQAGGGGGHTIGWLPYLASSTALEIVPEPWGGSTFADQLSTASVFSPGFGYPVVVPSMNHTFVCYGINDMIASTPTATIKANCKTFLQNLISYGSGVTLITAPPGSTSVAPNIPQATQDALHVALLQVADELDISCIDMFSATGGTYAAVSALVPMADGVHWANYYLWAQYVFRYCQQVIAVGAA